MSNTQLQTFTFPANSSDVRVINVNGEPWFALTDVLNAMGSTTRSSYAKASIINGLGDGVSDEYTILDSIGRQQDTTIVHEAGIWYLVSRSNTEMGRELNRWLFGTVLPSIRKTGSYNVNQTPELDYEERKLRMEEMKAEAELIRAKSESEQKGAETEKDKVKFIYNYANHTNDEVLKILASDRVKNFAFKGLEGTPSLTNPSSVVAGTNSTNNNPVSVTAGINQTDKYFQATDVLKGHLGLSDKEVKDNQSEFGKKLANHYRKTRKQNPSETNGYVNNKYVAIKVYYPDFWDEATQVADEFFDNA